MATRKGHLRQALGLMVRTRPFLLARLAVYGVFFFATVGFTATFVLLMRVYGDSAVLQLLILAIAAAIYLLGRRYLARHLMYGGHAPHVQAMVDSLKGEALPRGNAQIELAMRQVDEQYPETTRVIRLEWLVGRVLREARHVVLQPGELRPLPGFRKLGRVGALIGWVALKNVRHAVFGYTLWTGQRNIWLSAKRGLLLYADAAASLSTSAIRVLLTGVLFGLTLLALALWAGWGLVQMGNAEGPLILFAILAGLAKAVWVIKTALFDPLGLAWMLSVFVRHAESTPSVDAEWSDRMSESSRRFRELSETAHTFAEEEAAATVAANRRAEVAKAAEAVKAQDTPEAGATADDDDPEEPDDDRIAVVDD
jgi:hypothetical protein